MGRTDKYAAPEQLQGGQVDARTDIYAVGKILETLPCPSIYNKVKARCTKSKKEERYQSAEELKSHLPNGNSISHWWLALIPILVLPLAIWLYPLSQTTIEKEEVDTTDTIKQESVELDSADETIKSPLPSNKMNPHIDKSLMDDIKKAVESNMAIVLDTHQDSIRRSQDPNYSAGTYLKALNTSSAKQLSAKYPHISKDYITQTIDKFTADLLNQQHD